MNDKLITVQRHVNTQRSTLCQHWGDVNTQADNLSIAKQETMHVTLLYTLHNDNVTVHSKHSSYTKAMMGYIITRLTYLIII